tara:strand:- start:27 stop:200 length:174 start_codon:yes stop_codon:yes gene_type:complete
VNKNRGFILGKRIKLILQRFGRKRKILSALSPEDYKIHLFNDSKKKVLKLPFPFKLI